ncbi:MAG TPA: phosphatase PAP2 family protein [Rubrivivax sp.]|nr:phosphatase PAP2 family protein [Rubrivivax sp.]
MSEEVRLAQWLGANATAAFLIALAGMLTVVGAGWLAYRRLERGRGVDQPPAPRVLVLRLLVGLGVAVGAGLSFAELAEALDLSDGLARFDTALTAALRQHVSLAALRSFALVTRLGDTSTLTALGILVAGLLLVASQRRLALLWVLAIGGNSVLNVLLKGTFERVRPVYEHDLLLSHSGWSFPSGHSSGSVVAYGMLAYVLVHLVSPRWQLPLLLLATLLALTIGFSRVFLQVHYFSDVLAGFASGLVWLTICIVSSEWLRLRRSMSKPA